MSDKQPHELPLLDVGVPHLLAPQLMMHSAVPVELELDQWKRSNVDVVLHRLRGDIQAAGLETGGEITSTLIETLSSEQATSYNEEVKSALFSTDPNIEKSLNIGKVMNILENKGSTRALELGIPIKTWHSDRSIARLIGKPLIFVGDR
jgi:hypothetical protein